MPIHIPTIRDIPPPSLLNKMDATRHQASGAGDAKWEHFNGDGDNVDHLYDPKTSAAEAEKALRDLFQDSVNDATDEIDPADAIVDGFRDGVKLLDHQVQGRKWMKERETGKKTGGILADDMGCVHTSPRRAATEFNVLVGWERPSKRSFASSTAVRESRTRPTAGTLRLCMQPSLCLGLVC